MAVDQIPGRQSIEDRLDRKRAAGNDWSGSLRLKRRQGGWTTSHQRSSLPPAARERPAVPVAARRLAITRIYPSMLDGRPSADRGVRPTSGCRGSTNRTTAVHLEEARRPDPRQRPARTSGPHHPNQIRDAPLVIIEATHWREPLGLTRQAASQRCELCANKARSAIPTIANTV